MGKFLTYTGNLVFLRSETTWLWEKYIFRFFLSERKISVFRT